MNRPFGPVRHHLGLFWGAYVVLLCCISATVLVSTRAQSEIHIRQEAAFRQAQNKYQQVMDLHFSSYSNILNGVKAFCLQKPGLRPEEFNMYFDSLGMRQEHLGIFDIGYIARVPSSERNAVIAQGVRFGISPPYMGKFQSTLNDEYVLLYWDNFSPKPPVAYATHVFNDRERRDAMDQARDFNTMVATDRLSVQLGNNKVATNGFIVYLPVYKPGVLTQTVEGRRQALMGFVFASFFIPDCWGKINTAASEPHIDFEVYSGSIPNRETLWFDSDNIARAATASANDGAPLKSSHPISAMGRAWTICFTSSPGPNIAPELWIPKLMLAGGGLLSGVLFLLSFTQIQARVRTEALASQLRDLSQSLKQEKERLTVTLESIEDGVITVDAQNKVILMNRVAAQHTRRALDKVVGQPLGSLFVADVSQASETITDAVNEVIRTGKVWRSPKPAQIYGSEGATVLIAITASPMRDQTGRIDGVVVVIHDVTGPQKLLEEQIKTSKLESIGILAGGIAHDFNNILSTILGNISMAFAEAGKQTELSDFLKEAISGCDRARDLTQQLLTFAKGGAPVRKTANLTEIICDSARFATHGATIRCEYNLNPDMWLVDADKGQLSQVIHNIVLNATEAMAGGGIVQITSENRQLDASNNPGLPPGRYVRISIQDHGVGIHPDHLHKIFDPYFSTKQRGSGLGLATAYSIVRRHEGTIAVASDLGRGTRFDIYLPASAQQVSEPDGIQKADQHVGKGRLLIMDDEQPILNALSRMLQKLGYEVTAASDGTEAIKLYSEAKVKGQWFSAVIFDLTVPGGVGGQAAMAELLAMDPTVKGIVSSGYSNDPVMANYRDYGFQAVVPKPYGIDALKSALSVVLPKLPA